MIRQYYPGATFEPISYRRDAPLFAGLPLGWILHVQDGNGDPGPYFDRLVSPERVFSHLWFSKAGAVKQYQTLDRQSWAQTGGNPFYWSAETEGYPGEPLTAAQLGALRAWHKWSATPNRLASAPGQGGIGYHNMGTPAQRAAGGWKPTACPGPIRTAQRTQILTPTLAPAPALPRPPARPASRVLRLTRPYMAGSDVRAVQTRLGVSADSSYGPVTSGAVRSIQRRYWPSNPAMWDGIVGPLTARALGLPWIA